MATAKEVLLTSETFLKSVMPISDNVAGKYIQASIREAQEIGFKGIVGFALLKTLKEMVRDETLHDHPAYEELVQESQYYLAYSAVVELCKKVAFKIANMGVVRTSDEHVDSVSLEDVNAISADYQHKADAAAFELQGWIMENCKEFPELGERGFHRIHSNLKSAATCGIWLGGPRGKGPENPYPCSKSVKIIR